MDSRTSGLQQGSRRGAPPLTCHRVLPVQLGLAKAELLTACPVLASHALLPRQSRTPWPSSAPRARNCTLLNELDLLELSRPPRPLKLPNWLNTSWFSVWV